MPYLCTRDSNHQPRHTGRCQRGGEIPKARLNREHNLPNQTKTNQKTMAIKLKAIERNVAFEKGTQKWAFVMQPELYSRLTDNKVIQEAALRSGISKGAISAAYEAIGDVIRAWATEGHSVAVPGLGTMRFGVRANSVEKVDEVSTALITSRRVIFTPSVDIKDELARTAISITCYDRNGNVIKQVTSDDEGTIEDPDNEPTPNQPSNPNNGGTSGGSTSGGDDDDNGELAG